MSASDFPKKVRLRNGEEATVLGTARIGREDTEETFLQGTRSSGSVELWLFGGRWAYDQRDHPFDIVEFKLPCGSVVMVNQEKATA